MNTQTSSLSHARHKRALVLGGGGSTGNAWLIGVVAGLHDAGVDLTTAELIVGTSAGSTTAAQITGDDAAGLCDATLAEEQTSSTPRRPTAAQLARTDRIISDSRDAADMRRRMGEAALEMEGASDGRWSARWRMTVAARLPHEHWPDKPLKITSVLARTGAPAVFDRYSGIDLVDAVAASCASALPYWIGDEPYIDGGYRRNENADLASECERVLVLTPFGGRTRHPREWGMQLDAQVAELRAEGSRVETVGPDADAEHLFGANAMDPSMRPRAARVGREEGRRAGHLRDFWR